MAFCLLMKEIFLPPLILYVAYLFIILIRRKEYNELKYIIVFVIASVLPVLPWSYFASTHRNNLHLNDKEFVMNLLGDTVKPVMVKPDSVYDLDNDSYSITMVYKNSFIAEKTPIFLNSFPTHHLMNAHNEFITDTYQIQWQYIKTSFYRNDNLQGYPDVIRIIHFYLKNPEYIISHFYTKLISGFKYYKVFWLLLIVYIFHSLLNLFYLRITKASSKIISFIIILLTTSILLVSLQMHNYQFIIILASAAVLCDIFIIRTSVFCNLPAIININLVCYILLSFAILIYERHLKGISFIFDFCLFYFILMTVKKATEFLSLKTRESDSLIIR